MLSPQAKPSFTACALQDIPKPLQTARHVGGSGNGKMAENFNIGAPPGI